MRSLYNKLSPDIAINATAFQFNALAYWHICPLLEPVSTFCHSKIRALAFQHSVTVKFGLLHSQPFTNSNFHLLIIVKSVTSQVLLQRP